MGNEMRSCTKSSPHRDIIFAQCGVSGSRAMTPAALQPVRLIRCLTTLSDTTSNFAPDRINRSIPDIASSVEIWRPSCDAMLLNASPSHSNSSLERIRTRESRLPDATWRAASVSCCNGPRLRPIMLKLSSPTRTTTSASAGMNTWLKSALERSANDAGWLAAISSAGALNSPARNNCHADARCSWPLLCHSIGFVLTLFDADVN